MLTSCPVTHGMKVFIISQISSVTYWDFEMDKEFCPTLNNRYNYWSLLGLKLAHVSKGAMNNNQRPLSNCITSEFCIRNLDHVLTTWTTLPRNACEHYQWYSMEVQLCVVISDIIIGMHHIILAFWTFSCIIFAFIKNIEQHLPRATYNISNEYL